MYYNYIYGYKYEYQYNTPRGPRCGSHGHQDIQVTIKFSSSLNICLVRAML